MIRYIHMKSASFFFIVVHIHIFRGLYYGSYKAPRELLWMLGVVIFLLMMATAFMGYVLPWGQMSFWGATVITNLFSAIPFVGESIDLPVGRVLGRQPDTEPLLLAALPDAVPDRRRGRAHIVALHRFGSNNPIGIDAKGPQDTISFHPYYTIKDMAGIAMFLLLLAVAVFFFPNAMGHPDNYIPANPMQTPAHIVPNGIARPLRDPRAVPDKLGGVLLMFAAIFVLFVLPWLDRSPVRSARFRPLFRIFFWLLFIDRIALGYLGGKPAEGVCVALSRIATAWYFPHFLVVLPLLSVFETTRPLPKSISEPVLATAKGGRLMRKFLIAAVASLAATIGLAGQATVAGAATKLVAGKWSFAGPFGYFDKGAMQRGFQVYLEVCAAVTVSSIWRSATLPTLDITRPRSRPSPPNTR